MFRWWDGQAWTPTLTPDPYAPPPGQAPPVYLPMQDAAPGAREWNTAYADVDQRRSGRGPLVALGIVGVLVIALIVGGVTLLSGGRFGPLGAEPPASNPTGDVCPTRRVETAAPVRQSPAGRVQGGKLSYPQQTSPWGPVQPETRVAFGRDVWGQSVMVHPNYDGRGSSWVASVVVGELVAGDGFFSPRQGAEIVTRCVMGEFYGNAVLDRRDRVNQATTVDGKDAWLVEMHLGFDIPGLSEKGETAIILIVATAQESSSIYYASIPDSTPALLSEARRIQAQLRVEP